MVEGNMKYAQGGPLRYFFMLPFKESPSYSTDIVYLGISDATLMFSKDGQVLRYYTYAEDYEDFRLVYYDGSWQFLLEEENDLDWIPEEGCDWKFVCYRIGGEVCEEQTGVVKVWKRV